MHDSGLTTQYAPTLNQGTSAAKNTIARGTQLKSYRYREVPTRCRLQYPEDYFKIEIMKKTFPGSADGGKVPAKIFTTAVGPFYNRRRDRIGPTATIIENRHDSGWELRKLSSGYMYKKIRKTNSVHSSDF
jgi:hypothetical protein